MRLTVNLSTPDAMYRDFPWPHNMVLPAVGDTVACQFRGAPFAFVVTHRLLSSSTGQRGPRLVVHLQVELRDPELARSSDYGETYSA